MVLPSSFGGGIIEHRLVTDFSFLVKKEKKKNLYCQQDTLLKFKCALLHPGGFD